MEVVTVTDNLMDSYDVAVVGGGPAGLNGALMLGRARRSVLLIDAGEPRSAPAAAVRGFLSRDGFSPTQLTEIGRAEVRRYGGKVIRAQVTLAASTGDGFTVTLDDGQVFGARRLLVTTGLVDELPDIPGVRERWGRDVLHCPYYHDWEVRDQAIGVVATGPMAVHQALLSASGAPISPCSCTNSPQPDSTQIEQLSARDIKITGGRTSFHTCCMPRCSRSGLG